MNDEHLKPVPNLQEALRNLVQVLQTDPRSYRAFGAYWWAVKAILKRHGYTRDQFYGLGDFTDPDALRHIEPGPDELVLARALDFYQYFSRFYLNDPHLYYPDDGEPYELNDPDLNL